MGKGEQNVVCLPSRSLILSSVGRDAMGGLRGLGSVVQCMVGVTGPHRESRQPSLTAGAR